MLEVLAVVGGVQEYPSYVLGVWVNTSGHPCRDIKILIKLIRGGDSFIR